MDSLENITTVNDLLAAQTNEVVESNIDTNEPEEKTDFDKGGELLQQIRDLSPEIWQKIARALLIDISELHRDMATYLKDEGKHDKAMGWAYDTAVLDMLVAALDKVKL